MSNSNRKPPTQLEWIIPLFWEYKRIEGDDAYLRGFHYALTTKKLSDWWIPTEEVVDGKKVRTTREYPNTPSMYNRLSELMGQARIKGLIPLDAIKDEKNPPYSIGVEFRNDAELQNVHVDPGGYLSAEAEEMRSWDELIESLGCGVSTPHFYSQKYRVLLVVEKSKATESLKRLAKQYGADFIHFGGQHSITRVIELVERAKKENRPVKIFYIADLDIAGWDMPNGFMKRVKQLYPHPDNDVQRIALWHEQAVELGLPESFDPDFKKYSKSRVERFKRESGSNVCIEVDACPKEWLLDEVRKALEPYAEEEKDRERFYNLKEKLDDELEMLNLVEFKAEYDDVEEEFNSLVEEFREIVDKYEQRIHEVEHKQRDVKERIKEKIWEHLSNEEVDI